MKEVQVINEKLQNTDPAFMAASPQALYELSIWCAAQKAFTGEQMAIAKKKWQDAKKKAYETFVVSNEANQARVEKFGVMVVKDYIAACCGDLEAQYEYIERTNNACGYMEDAARSVMSSLREEAKSYNYGSQP
jgi:SAM-dependent MidA family methyltransferase